MLKNKKDIRTFQRDLKDEKLKGVICLYGIEDYMIDWAKEQIITKFIEPATREMDLEYVDIKTREFKDLESSIFTLPFFSKKRVVIIKGYKGEYKKEILGLEDEIGENILLLLSKENYFAKDKLLAYEFDTLEKEQLISFISKRFKEKNIEINRGLAISIANESGYLNKDVDYNLYNLESDIIKISSFIKAHKKGVDQNFIKELMSDTLEHNIFGLLDDMVGMRKNKALERLNDLILSGIDVMNILSNIINHLEVMYQIKEMLEVGVRIEDISKKTGIHEYRAKKVMRSINSYSLDRIKKLLIRAYEVDVNIKRGLLEGKLALEVFIAGI